MLFNLFQGDFDLLSFAKNFLISLPVFLIALIFHETAHALVAYWRGDPTAKLMGRLTLNPARHLDPMGLLFVFVVGVGWAKPVPVNPNNFKNPHRDDLLVSLAGITMNLLLSLFSLIFMFFMITLALNQVPQSAFSLAHPGYFETATPDGIYLMTASQAYEMAFGMDFYLITPFLGTVPGYLYTFFIRLFVVNLSLAVFNLLPIPPLDGYHVLNDLILRGSSLFASRRMQQIGGLIMVLLLISGALDKALNFILMNASSGAGQLFRGLACAMGFI